MIRVIFILLFAGFCSHLDNSHVLIAFLYAILDDSPGLLGKPRVATTPSVFKITSTNTSQSSILVVTRNEVETTMSTYFGNDDVYFSMTITFKNVANILVKDLTCKRCQDMLCTVWFYCCHIFVKKGE
jgi:hypothetical protein